MQAYCVLNLVTFTFVIMTVRSGLFHLGPQFSIVGPSQRRIGLLLARILNKPLASSSLIIGRLDGPALY